VDRIPLLTWVTILARLPFFVSPGSLANPAGSVGQARLAAKLDRWRVMNYI